VRASLLWIPLALGVLVGAGAVWWLRAPHGPAGALESERPARVVASAPTATAPPAPPEREPPSEPEPPDDPVHPDRRYAAEQDADGAAGSMPTQIVYQIAEQYRDEQLSQAVPHRLIGAFESDIGGRPGSLRAFIAVVDPGLSDRDLTLLARDARARHRDAEVLTVRIYDSAEAATTPSWTDGGEAQRAHLVAEVTRNARSARDEIAVRGRALQP
jgi:hypothetical protein